MCLDIAVLYPELVLSKGEHLGYEWVVTTNGMGYRCGYVRVPVGHPWHGGDWESISASVHGGITYARPDMACNKGGEDNAWWVGFDCGHAFDAPDLSLPFVNEEGERHAKRAAEIHREFKSTNYVIRTQEYVEEECKSLCEQACAAYVVEVKQ